MAIGTVLVTGAASGLGTAVAQAVAGAGGTPVLLDRVPPAFDADHEIVDLAERADADAAVARVVDRHPDLSAVGHRGRHRRVGASMTSPPTTGSG